MRKRFNNSLTLVITYILTHLLALNGQWVGRLLSIVDRKTAEIHFHPHAEANTKIRAIDVDKIVETVRSGKIIWHKCEYPDKIAFKRFFNDGWTYTAITKIYPDSIQVKTIWKEKGKW